MLQYDLLLKDLSATRAQRGANLLLEALRKALGLYLRRISDICFPQLSFLSLPIFCLIMDKDWVLN
jgi:hypothetical protein